MCPVNSTQRVTAFSSRSLSLRLFLWNLQSDIWKPIEASQSYSFLARSLLLRLFLLCFQSDILKPIEGYVEKGNSSVKNWKEALRETALCSVNSSHRITAFTSGSLSLRLFLWDLQSDLWKHIEGYGEKGNIFR